MDEALKPEHKLVVIGAEDAFLIGVLSSRIHLVWALAQGALLEDRPVYPKTECFDPFPFPDCDEAAKARIRTLGEELDAHRKRVQAEHPGLSLTAMYNVLEALRAARPLTAKEKAIHDNGLVTILRQLHDELDAAVAAAYGWPVDLTEAELLHRLVALNTARAAEEATGKIRWLRPAYQAPTGTATQTTLKVTPKAAKAPKPAKPKKQPWPKTMAERVRAVEAALKTAPAPQTAETLAKTYFLRTKPPEVGEILETLTALGHAKRDGERFTA